VDGPSGHRDFYRSPLPDEGCDASTARQNRIVQQRLKATRPFPDPEWPFASVGRTVAERVDESGGLPLRVCLTIGGGPALLSNARLATLFNLPLAVAAAWLLWRSLDWPLVGDATIFHFIAGQFQMGAVPYRDIFDVNMPLVYFVHAAVIAIGGLGDAAWRAFDLTAAVLVSGLILMLVWPAGRAVAILAVLIVLVTHFLLGPYSAGQRDFLMSIPALAAALASTKSAEDQQHDRIYLMLVGVFAMTAASIKPSGILLLLLPVFTTVKRDWRELQWVIIGAAGPGS
jgi:hypothetical protein